MHDFRFIGESDFHIYIYVNIKKPNQNYVRIIYMVLSSCFKFASIKSLHIKVGTTIKNRKYDLPDLEKNEFVIIYRQKASCGGCSYTNQSSSMHSAI